LSDHEVNKQGDGFVLQADAAISVDGRAHKMSKSRGNVVNPDEVVEQFGADAFRLYEMFLGPLEQVKPWSSRGVEGTYRFLNRSWRLITGGSDFDSNTLSDKIGNHPADAEQLRLLHATLKKVTEDIEALRFNTAIASMMEFTNAASRWDQLPQEIVEQFVLILSPFAPHLAEELWQRLGHTESLAFAPWPQVEDRYLVTASINIAVQVNGKLRANIEIPADADQESALARARTDINVSRHLEGVTIRREIYVPGRIINFVVG
jgi:leucyl-tRNA synthetase